MNKTIVIAEPNNFICAHLQTIFNKLAFPVVLAPSLQDAGNALVQQEVGFVLMSTQFPGVQAAQSVAYCRQCKPNVPVILLLTDEEGKNAQAIWAASQSNGYVLKTSTLAELSTWVQSNSQSLLGYQWNPPTSDGGPEPEIAIDPAEIDQLIADVASEDFSACANACNELGKARSAAAVDALIERLFSATDELKIYIIWALGEIRDKRCVPDLVGLLNYIDPQIREGVIDALSKIKDPRTVRPLSRMLKIPDKKTQIMALKALGMLGSREAIEILEPMLSTPDGEIRANVQWAIRKIDGVDH